MDEQLNTPTGSETEATGLFNESLIRSNKQIKADRAQEITEEVETVYRRKVEDMGLKLKRLKMKQRSALDFSPDSAMSLKPANTIDADVFADEDLKFGREIRDLEILYTLACKRYTELFGKHIVIAV